MKIWYGTTTARFNEYKDYYYAIRQHLINSKHILVDDWMGNYGKRIENPTADRGIEIRKIYQKVIAAIDKCDISIIEFTVPNFSSSHQINYALFQKKPTLVLRLEKDNRYKDSYIEAIDSPFLTIKDCTKENFKEIIDEFLGYVDLGIGQGRYNIVLGNKHKYFLDWASTKYKKSRSEIIRELIETYMKKDSDFKKYLKD